MIIHKCQMSHFTAHIKLLTARYKSSGDGRFLSRWSFSVIISPDRVKSFSLDLCHSKALFSGLLIRLPRLLNLFSFRLLMAEILLLSLVKWTKLAHRLSWKCACTQTFWGFNYAKDQTWWGSMYSWTGGIHQLEVCAVKRGRGIWLDKTRDV